MKLAPIYRDWISKCAVHHKPTDEGKQASSLACARGLTGLVNNDVTECPSSDNLRLIERFSKRGSGSSGARV